MALEDKNFQDNDNEFIDKLVFINRVATLKNQYLNRTPFQLVWIVLPQTNHIISRGTLLVCNDPVDTCVLIRLRLVLVWG